MALALFMKLPIHRIVYVSILLHFIRRIVSKTHADIERVQSHSVDLSREIREEAYNGRWRHHLSATDIMDVANRIRQQAKQSCHKPLILGERAADVYLQMLKSIR